MAKSGLFGIKSVLFKNCFVEPMLEPTGTISPAPFGLSPTAAIRRSFCSNLPETGKHGWDGSLKPRNAMV
jgi:hypothetical protein